MFRTILLVLTFAAVMSSSVAQRPDAPLYGQTGPYTVGVSEHSIEDDERPINLTIWYPAEGTLTDDNRVRYRVSIAALTGNAIADGTPLATNSPYPLVIFSHGNGGSRFQSTFLTEHLASHGFAVAALDHPTNNILDQLSNAGQFEQNLASNYIHRPHDVLRVIDYVASLDAPFDSDKVAIIGHSFGGYTALATAGHRLNFDQLRQWCSSQAGTPLENVCFLLNQQQEIADVAGVGSNQSGAWPAITDDRIKAVVAMAPWNSVILDQDTLSSNDIPTMLMIGLGDNVTPPSRDAVAIYNRLLQSTPKALLTFELGGHNLFFLECNDQAIMLGLFDACSEPVWDKRRAHDIINHFTTGFLKSVVVGDVEADVVLDSTHISLPGVSYVTATQQVAELVPEVISVRPHDTSAWTQGLLLHNGLFYESTGLRGASTLREVDPETGEVLRGLQLPDQYFGEGLTLVDDTLIQLTWQSGAAFYFDLETFEFQQGFSYSGEGWGLCYDGNVLHMTDGSDTVFQRDPETFQLLSEFTVTMRGEPVVRLNELECVGDAIYANIWQTDYIVRIDRVTGEVNARIDASDLVTPEERQAFASGEVLNGIAYDPENDVFFITGKHWPNLYEVRFVAP